MEKTEQKQSFTDKIIDKIMIIAEPLGKFAATPIVSSLQAGISASIPLIIIGSLFLVLGAAVTGGIGFTIFPSLAEYSNQIYLVYQFGMGFMGLYIAVACGMAYAEKLDVPVINAALLCIASFLAITFNDVASGMYPASFGVGNMFPGVLSSMISVKIFSIFLKKNLIIKMPEQVPANVASAFTSLIPYAVIIIMWWLIRTVLGFDLNGFFANVITPILDKADTFWAYMLDRVLSGIFWSVGLHYDNMVSSVKATLMMQWTAENASVVAAQGTSVVLPHIWTYAIDNWCTKVGYAWPVVFYLLTSKAKGLKQIGVSVILPVFFCIIEPLWFSVPVIMNPYMMFGITASTIVSGAVAYIMFSLNVCTRPFVTIPWACPDILGGYLTTGGDWRFLIILAVEFVVGLIVWYPFFKAYERKLLKDEAEKEALLETETK